MFELGEGLIVKSVLTELESTRVIVGNIPEGFSERELREMLERIYGFVAVHIPKKSTPPIAIVDFQSSDSATEACTVLDGATFAGKALSARLEPLAAVSSNASLRDNLVKVTWFAPSSMAYAHYDDLSEARAVSRKIHGQDFYGRKFEASVQEPSWSQTTSYTIVLRSLPPVLTGAMKSSLYARLGTSDIDFQTPRHDNESIIEHIRITLDDGTGRLESLDPIPFSPSDTKIKAIARYGTSADAMRAVNSIHNTRPRYLNKSPLFLTYMPSMKFSFEVQLYNCIRRRIDSLKESSSNVRWTVYEGFGGDEERPKVAIRIAADALQDLGAVKAKMETLLLGSQLKDGGRGVWDDKLKEPSIRGTAEKLAAGAGGYVRCDSRRHAITVYGPDQSTIEAVGHILRNYIHEVHQTRHSLPVSPAILGQLIRFGPDELRERCGEGVSLDISTRTLLVQTENNAQLDSIRQFLDSLSGRTRREHQSSQECPVCLCEPTRPVALECGHQYCASCLDFMLQNPSHFRIVCLTDGCSLPISLATLRSCLSLQAVDQLTEAAARAYLDEHPNEFKHCPTADCTHIYRPGPEGSVVQCRGCLVDICAACHVSAHDGLTCAERRSLSDPNERLFRRWSLENSTKPCPNCGIYIQKVTGCNHMTCTGCKAHWCWVCSGRYPSQDIYDHMQKSHGGIGIDYDFD